MDTAALVTAIALVWIFYGERPSVFIYFLLIFLILSSIYRPNSFKTFYDQAASLVRQWKANPESQKRLSKACKKTFPVPYEPYNMREWQLGLSREISIKYSRNKPIVVSFEMNQVGKYMNLSYTTLLELLQQIENRKWISIVNNFGSRYIEIKRSNRPRQYAFYSKASSKLLKNGIQENRF